MRARRRRLVVPRVLAGTTLLSLVWTSAARMPRVTRPAGLAPRMLSNPSGSALLCCSCLSGVAGRGPHVGDPA